MGKWRTILLEIKGGHYLNVRKAKEGDLSAICRLSDEINADHFLHMPLDFLKPDGSDRDAPYWLEFMTRDNAMVFVSEHDGALTGAVAVTVSSTAPLTFLTSRPRAHLATIVVTKSHRGQGIGRALMSAAEAYAKENGAEDIKLEVMAYNARAVEFYRELGYDDFSRKLSKPLV